MTIPVKQTHAYFRKMLPLWKFYWESYIGGESYIQAGHLYSHRLEGNTDYRNRLERAYYYNFCETVIDIYTSHVFKNPTVRRSNDPEFLNFLTNVDRRGNTIAQFAKEMAEAAQIYGIVFVVVDKPVNKEPVSNRAEEIEKGLLPYFSLIYPTQVLDWDVDTNGELLWIKIQEPSNKTVSHYEQRPSIPQNNFRIWTKENWELYDQEGTLISSAPHNLGVVPVATCYARKINDLQGKSIISDIAFVNRAIFNWCALLDEILYRQTFSQMVIQADSDKSLENSNKEILKAINILEVKLEGMTYLKRDIDRIQVQFENHLKEYNKHISQK